MESRTVNSKRNIISGIISSLVVPFLGFIIRTAVARTLGEEYLGLSSFLNSVLQVLSLAELGFSSAVIVSLYKPINDGDEDAVRGILSYYRKAYLIIGLVITIAGCAFAPFIHMFIGDTKSIHENIEIIYMVYLLNTAVSYFLFSYKEALLNALQRFDVVKKTFTLVYLAKSVLQLVALKVTHSYLVFSIILVGCTILYNIILQFISVKYYSQYYPDGNISKQHKRTIKEQIMGLSISKVLDVARNALDSVILTAFLGLSIVGIYNNYYYIYNTVIGIMWVIISAIQASVGNSIVSELKEKNYKDLIKFEFAYNIIITFFTTCLMTLYQPFMKIWMGEGLLLSDTCMVLFVLYFYVMAMNGVRNAYFNALGLWWKGKWIAIAESISNLILNIVLGKLWGVYGILIATLITMLVLNYFGFTQLLFKEYFKSGVLYFYRDRLVYSFITAIICVIASVACNQIMVEGIIGLIIKLVVSMVVFVVLFFSLMIAFKRKQLKEGIEFIKGIISA